MIFIEFFQSFLSPSVFIFLFFIIGLVFLFLKKSKAAKILLVISVFFYFLFSISPISDLLLSPLEKQYKYPERSQIEEIDKVVVLSGGVKNKDLPLPSALGDSTLIRLIEALKIYSLKEEKPIIIVSGTSPIDNYSKEALFGISFLELYGVPKEHVAFELMSENTFQHALELKKMLGGERFLLITSAYHLPRTMMVFKKADLNAVPVPTDYQSDGRYTFLDFLPQAKNLKKSTLAFHEYFGILYYKFFK